METPSVLWSGSNNSSLTITYAVKKPVWKPTLSNIEVSQLSDICKDGYT